MLTFWHRNFTFNSNKSPTWCNSFSVYYPDVCLQLNMFRAFSHPSSGAQLLRWQPLVLPSYRGDSRVVFVVGTAIPVYRHSVDRNDVLVTWWTSLTTGVSGYRPEGVLGECNNRRTEVISCLSPRVVGYRVIFQISGAISFHLINVGWSMVLCNVHNWTPV